MLTNTVIVFTTDNGAPLNNEGTTSNYPLRGGKASFWEGGMKGAAFVWSNLLNKTAYENNKLIHACDWLPTFAYLAGVDIPAEK